MTKQMAICILLFVLMLFNFLPGKFPLGVIAGTTTGLLVLTGCTEAKTVLSGFGNANTLTILAAGLGRTSFPSKITASIRNTIDSYFSLSLTCF